MCDRAISELATFNFQPVTKLVPKVGIAPTSPPLQGGANLPQLLGEMWCEVSDVTCRVRAPARHVHLIPRTLRLVVPRGNAPRSPGYRPGALLLSYRTILARAAVRQRRASAQ